MRYISATILLFLLGCTPVPVKRNFPDPVPELMKECKDLSIIEGETVSIIDMLKVIVDNYKSYYVCSTKVEGWQKWYKEQKELFDSVK